MPMPDERLQQIIASKDVENAVWGECWTICDGALVIYLEDDPPAWLPEERDEDGNTPDYVEAHRGET
jgi:hypothetical protein